MYLITRSSDGAVLYDVDNPSTCPMTDPRGTFEIGQAGSLQFSLVPVHPLYDGVEVMETYVRANKDNVEIFYGRVIDVNIDKTTGIKQVECAGALQFLEDGEVSPIQAEEEPSGGSNSENDEEEQSQEKGVQMTAAEFFRRCVNDYNADIQNDARRKFEVGHIWPEKAGEIQTYNISSYTQAKTAIETNLISEYGGYLRARRGDQDKLYLDWVGIYDEQRNASPIRLRENIISQENAISANGFFTVIRPIGKDNLGLTAGTMAVDATLVAKYGRIIKTVTFGYAETQADLEFAAQRYINEIAKGTSHIGTIKLIDMHFLDNSIPTIRLGSTYTNIAGFEGEDMIVAGMELNFASPQDDSITLKNRRELEANQKDGTSGRGPLSKKIQEQDKGQKGFQNIWQHITEGENWLRIAAERVEINAQELVELVGTFERYAEESRQQFTLQNEAINGNTLNIDAMRGTGVLQNSDQITQVAGLFSTKYYVVRSTSGRNPHNSGWYEARTYIPTEEDVGTGVELFVTVQEALLGNAVNTQRDLIPGNAYVQMVPTSDTTAVSGKTYYSKTLGLLNGASLSVSEDGVETNVGTLIKETSEGLEDTKTTVSLIEGSALWTERNLITAVCGEYEVREDSQGNKTLVIKSGGGLKIRKDGTEFGLYTEDNLNAGVIVGWINDPENTDIIEGSRININASQVKVGSTSDVATWMTNTGGDINDLRGLVADRATIGQLNVLNARIDNIDAEYIDSLVSDISILHGQSAYFSGAIRVGSGLYLGSDATDVSKNLTKAVIGVDLGNNGKTLILTQADGTVTNFNKAAEVTIRNLILGSRHADSDNNEWSATVYYNPESEGSVGTTISLTAAANYYKGLGKTEGINEVGIRSVVLGSRDVASASNEWSTTVYYDPETKGSAASKINLTAAANYYKGLGKTEGINEVGISSVVLGSRDASSANNEWSTTVYYTPDSKGSAASKINLTAAANYYKGLGKTEGINEVGISSVVLGSRDAGSSSNEWSTTVYYIPSSKGSAASKINLTAAATYYVTAGQSSVSVASVTLGAQSSGNTWNATVNLSPATLNPVATTIDLGAAATKYIQDGAASVTLSISSVVLSTRYNDLNWYAVVYSSLGATSHLMDLTAARNYYLSQPNTAEYNRGWNACRNEMINKQYTSTFYSGSQTVKYDAPTGGASPRTVIYPWEYATITRYYVPAAR